MPDGPAALEEAYNAVEDIVNEVEQYVKVRVILILYAAFKLIPTCFFLHNVAMKYTLLNMCVRIHI